MKCFAFSLLAGLFAGVQGLKITLPNHVTKEKEAEILKKLSVEEKTLANSLKNIKAMAKKHDDTDFSKTFAKGMSDKSREKWEQFENWDKHMNEKAKVGAVDVLSKLRNAIHFIKKGALSGNDKAKKNLDDVVSKMGQMV